MRRCLTPEATGDTSGKELYEVDLDKKVNWLREVKIGETAKTELKKLKDGKKISNASYSSFFRRAKQLYRKGISELFRTFPLKNSLLRYPQVLHPIVRNVMQSKEAVRQVARRIKFQRIGIVILPRTLMMMSRGRKKTLPIVTKW